MKRFSSSLLWMLVAGFVCSCAGPVRPTGYLSDYGGFNTRNEEDFKVRLLAEHDHSLDGYFLTELQAKDREKSGEPVPDAETDGVDLESAQPVLFVVAAPQWVTAQTIDAENQEKVLFTIRERFYRYLLRQYPHPVRVRYAWSPEESITAGYRVITLESAVTEIRKGNGTLRYVIGYGAGACILQLEGRLLDGGADGVPLAEFAIREEHAGYAQGFMNPRVFSDGYVLRYAAEEAIDKITCEVREMIPAARPAPAAPVP